jgi:hypothetical protein
LNGAVISLSNTLSISPTITQNSTSFRSAPPPATTKTPRSGLRDEDPAIDWSALLRADPFHNLNRFLPFPLNDPFTGSGDRRMGLRYEPALCHRQR